MSYKYSLATKLIHHYEGFEYEPYKDAVGIWTVGWGRTSGAMLPTTKEKEKVWLELELRKLNTFINSVVDPHQSPEQMAALMSFIYNVGPSAFRRSTFLRTINNNRPDPNELLKWSKAGTKVLPGLAKRRMSEYLLYNSGKLITF